ncbi:unnamed protein product, partial [Meganyctiphanes norvegica]
VVIQAVTGTDKEGVVAVDDILINPGKCDTPLSCTFDDGLCLWTQLDDDTLDMEVVHKYHQLHDHTHGDDSGSFMILKIGDPEHAGDTAAIMSESILLTDKSCLSFWWNMNGSGLGKFRVKRIIPDTGFEKIIWEVQGEKTNATAWRYGCVTVWKVNSDSNVCSLYI